MTRVLVTLAALLSLAFQEPRPRARTGSINAGDSYGTPQPVELWDLQAGVYDRRAVVTKGVLGQLEQKGGQTFYDLRDGGGHAVILLVVELQGNVRELLGRRVEVVGYVRALVENQGTCPGIPPSPMSYCNDPLLPVTPDLTSDRQSWPRVSITIWSINDITPFEHRVASDSGSLDGPPGARVTLLGRFAGANLAGELPSSPPEPGAWVLKTGEKAIWVVGKEPRGKGWSFNPAYRGDVGKWLEVQGRLATCGAVPCLRAARVALTAAPAGETEN